MEGAGIWTKIINPLGKPAEETNMTTKIKKWATVFLHRTMGSAMITMIHLMLGKIKVQQLPEKVTAIC